jgi:hypothetical protein
MNERPNEDDLKVLEAMNKGNERNPYWTWQKLSETARELISASDCGGLPFTPNVEEVAEAICQEGTRYSGMYDGEFIEDTDEQHVLWLRGYIAASEHLTPIINDLSTPEPIYIGPNGEKWQGGAFDDIPLWIRDSGFDRSYFRDWGDVEKLSKVGRCKALYDKKKIDAANWTALKLYDEANKK